MVTTKVTSGLMRKIRFLGGTETIQGVLIPMIPQQNPRGIRNYSPRIRPSDIYQSLVRSRGPRRGIFPCSPPMLVTEQSTHLISSSLGTPVTESKATPTVFLPLFLWFRLQRAISLFSPCCHRICMYRHSSSFPTDACIILYLSRSTVH